MAYVTAEQIQAAKQMDLLTYLKLYEPQELVQISPDNYCTRTHDSLKISNGKWHWFSRGIGGRTALDYLIKVQGYSFVQAVETLCGQSASLASPPPAKPPPIKVLQMPELNSNTDRVVRYLMGRGIHRVILDECLSRKLLFETKQYHNAMFVGYDQEGQIRYASLRGTLGNFKGEVSGSDKRHSFSLAGQPDSTTVHVFESAIDAMSYATLLLLTGHDWRLDHLLSLAGVFHTKREGGVPASLSRYLKEYPGIKTLRLHLDNDLAGRSATAGIITELQGKYEVLDQPPTQGKDVNEYLQMRVGLAKREPREAR